MEIVIESDESGGDWWYPVRLRQEDRTFTVRQFTNIGDAQEFALALGRFLPCKVLV